MALPLLGSEWELRYYLLSGDTLSGYLNAKDTGFSPREEYNIMGSFVAWEGLRGGSYWTLSLLDSGGSLVVSIGAPVCDGHGPAVRLGTQNPLTNRGDSPTCPSPFQDVCGPKCCCALPCTDPAGLQLA